MEMFWQRRGTVLEWNWVGGDVYADSTDVKSIPITVYDEASNQITVGNIDDIIDKESAGANCSKIFFEMTGDIVRALIAFNFE